MGKPNAAPSSAIRLAAATDASADVRALDRPTALLAVLRWRMAPYGCDSFFDAYTAADAMHLDTDTMHRIACPLLITDPDHEQFWPGQSAELHAGGPTSTLVRFTEAEGANWHCEPAAAGLRDERIFDWLEDVVARK